MQKLNLSQLYDSEDSEEPSESPKPSSSKVTEVNNRSSSSSESSSEEQESRASTPPPAPKRSASASPKKKVFGNPIERFFSDNPKLIKLDVGDVISKHDDVCLLEVPKSFCPTNFSEKLINFDKKTKIKINKIRYVIEPSFEDVKPINLLSDKINIIHPISVLKLRENRKCKNKSEAVEFEGVTPSLPDNLKVRHPLFGSQYKPKIILDEEIQRKLDSVIEGAAKKLKKKKHRKEENKFLPPPEINESRKKKKKHKKEKQDEESGFASTETDFEEPQKTELDESFFALLESHVTGKKNKGHKSNSQEEVLETSKEHKKKKKDKSKSTEENLSKSFTYSLEEKNQRPHQTSLKEEILASAIFEEGGRKKHRNKIEERSDPVEEGNVSKTKKHNRSIKEEKNISELGSFEDENIGKSRKRQKSIREETEVGVKTEQESPKKRKNSMKASATFLESFEDVKNFEKRNERVANSTIIPGLQLPLFEFDVSGIANKETDLSKSEEKISEPVKEQKAQKQSKKKKDKSFENNESFVKHNDTNEENEAYTETELSHDSGKKKKKRKHVDEQESSPKKIKKEKSEENDVTNSLILDILNKVKHEMDTPVVHKKKRKSDR